MALSFCTRRALQLTAAVPLSACRSRPQSQRLLTGFLRQPRHRAVQSSTSVRGMADYKVPAQAWDSHMHVLEPGYELAKSSVYKPHDALLKDAQANADRLSLPNMVFVQPSPYGFDNSCQLDALRRHGSGRAVLVFDPDNTTPQQLREWHAQGARGVRVNLKSVKREMSAEELAALLHKYANLIRPLKTWCLQVYVDLHIVPQLEDVVDDLGVKLVIDHMGGPPQPQPDMSSLAGWDSLLRLLEKPNVFVKVSAAYRFTPGTEKEEFHEFEPVVKPLLAARGGKSVVFASDWPHTRHEYTDPEPWLRRCIEWCGANDSLKNDLFRDNARRLWDAE